MGVFGRIFELIDVTKYDYKKLIILPMILVLMSTVAVATLGINYGIDLRGGTLATVQGVK